MRLPGLSVTGRRPRSAAFLNKLKFYYQMDKKQNQRREWSGRNCSNCGGAKFIAGDEMSEDQKLVAKRLTEIVDFHSAEIVFCARCLYPALLPTEKA